MGNKKAKYLAKYLAFFRQCSLGIIKKKYSSEKKLRIEMLLKSTECKGIKSEFSSHMDLYRIMIP